MLRPRWSRRSRAGTPLRAAKARVAAPSPGRDSKAQSLRYRLRPHGLRVLTLWPRKQIGMLRPLSIERKALSTLLPLRVGPVELARRLAVIATCVGLHHGRIGRKPLTL